LLSTLGTASIENIFRRQLGITATTVKRGPDIIRLPPVGQDQFSPSVNFFTIAGEFSQLLKFNGVAKTIGRYLLQKLRRRLHRRFPKSERLLKKTIRSAMMR